MTNAEKRAFEAYPIVWEKMCGDGMHDINGEHRECYLQGYKQAEKDMKITWRQIKYIVELEGNMDVDMFMGSQEYYEEMARRCNTVMMYGLQDDVITEMEE